MPSLKGPIITFIVVALLSFALYQSSLDIAAGGMREFYGKNAGIKSLIQSLAGTLGTTGSMIVGGVLTLAAVLLVVRAVIKRQQAKALKQA